MKSKIFEYKSGLRLVHRKILGIKSVSMGVLIGAGSCNETDKNNGISHFIEHMFFKGTKNRDPFQISADIDGFGAQINAFTSKQTTCYYTISTRDQVENCAEVLHDILFNSTFDETEMKREKGVVLEEISMSEDDPSDVCLESLASAFFKGNSLGYTILGTRKNIKAFTRKDITDYIKANYCAESVVVSVVGNIDYEDAKALVERNFEGGFLSNSGRVWQDTSHISMPEFVYTKKDIEQANISVGFPSFSFKDKRLNALKLVNTLFGGGMSSRLFQNIREKQGLAYAVYSYPSTYINNGLMQIYVGTNIESAVPCCKTLKEEIIKIKRDGISKTELERGKQQLKGMFVLGQESSSSVMQANAKFALFSGDCYDLDSEIAKIDALTFDEVNEVAEAIFDFDKMSVSYTGREVDANLRDTILNA